MKLFLISWDGKELGLIDAALKLKENSHEIVYWTYFRDESIDKSKFPKTVFHNVFDALAGKPADGIDTLDFLPPGEDLLKQFYETESVILTMMHKKFEWSPIEQRKHFYHHFLQYWYGVIKKLKPDAIIYSSIPHTVYDFVIYDLARKLGIKIIIFEDILIANGWVIVMNDYKAGSADLIKQIKENAYSRFSLADLNPDTRAHYKSQTENGGDKSPLYLKEDLVRYRGLSQFLIKLRSLWTTLTVLKEISVLWKALTYLPRQFGPNLKKEHLSVQSAPDFGKKYVYVTLQYQPEAQTCPQAGVFSDQILMVETLASVLPEGWLVYVKEHRIVWLRRGLNYYDCRYKGYYREIAKLKNVRLVPIETDSFQLIRHSQAVATGAGTVGWEAILRGKPALIFGYPWYQHSEGVFKIKDAASCREALEKIKNGFKVSQEKIINFLTCLDRVSLQAYFHPYIQRTSLSKISVRQNSENIAGAIEAELKKLNAG
ncbi:hypothetical protein A3G55_00425 [Candidatus Giovannonibacteria bacterium RIFCSPLOWO2_12_FULL_44_25]|uniref:Capsular polysaccharide biosynthesis protein n=3 Tax=Parcubacteria group TaxID=1794811 RepID=A0A837IKG2_9BACT|nr:MAG: capsular polysaccharide biosynthesis protein [Parcubacteria group bacterium GW2011_GWC1_44_10]KKT60399.1 MAG: capsular polysaccharide biosynthesis protein [Candidatus Giovannonibacteria bacterium GW2011_GWA1_44_25]KKU12663.1 MAG: capsular polysaccharide biosynthesis protein [Candidatus Azambacteria bacterium GW2011_GWC2_45_7b]KKU30257.1 MAG: capsular polysaccharide biosynthesis protein [Candidatus Giovannonibacteria bacterium GW2011_GWB1_46_20]OGF50465.1 MAG: hypothetical protein A2120_